MERLMAFGLVLTLITAGLLLVFAFRQPEMQRQQAQTQLTMTVREGAHLFVANECFSCHGIQGQGLPGLGLPLNGTELPHEEIVRTIQRGRENSQNPEGEDMPAFGRDEGGSLSEHQIEILANFIQNWNQDWVDQALAETEEH